MPSTKTPLPKNTPRQEKLATEADVQSHRGQSQQPESSHDAKSHTKAGSTEGAGGGKKQERKH